MLNYFKQLVRYTFKLLLRKCLQFLFHIKNMQANNMLWLV